MTRIAIFDFDHTLIEGDSFLPFLSYATGKSRIAIALAEAVTLLGLCQARGEKPELRSFIKGHLIKSLLAGRKREDLRDAAARTNVWQRRNPSLMETLHEHADKGDKILIASGGLDLYLPEMLHDLPDHELICTNIGVENGFVTGQMIHGNCVRLRKAERVGAWLRAQGECEESFAYGNYPHDVPMMNLVKYRMIVS